MTATGGRLGAPMMHGEKLRTFRPEMTSTGEAIAFVDGITDERISKPIEMRNLYLSR